MTTLRSLSLDFREDYLDYETLTRQLRAWADAFPSLIRVESIGKTPQGRDLWLVTVGPEPDRVRPAVWIDANMHASELAGSSVALACIEDVLRLHLQPNAALHDISEPVREVLRDVLFVVMPRVSPDGAEAVLRGGRFIRSVPRDDRSLQAPRWQPRDLDGDGLCLMMRIEDASGDYVQSRHVPGLMVPREIDDAGPYYRLFPEAIVEPWDGHHLPTPGWLSNNDPDLNRNFPYAWAPAHEQEGAGPFPLSAPESRAIAQAAVARPNLYAWLDLHTFGGVFIRPLGHAPDNEMDRGDLAIFRQVEQWAEQHTGYPTVSGFEDFTYRPNQPLHGDLTDFAYHTRGCIAYVCELWNLFHQLGLPRGKRFVDYYFAWNRQRLEELARWDAVENESRVFRPWVEVEHPQLGKVEVGGFDPRIGIWNPPQRNLPGICDSQAAAFVRVAAMVPRLHVEPPQVRPLGSDTFQIEVHVENRGYLPTYGLPSSRELDFNEPLIARTQLRGLTLVEPGEGLREVGHLEGWGRGAGSGFGSPMFPWSFGSTSRSRLRWVVQGSGRFEVTVGSSRVGWHSASIDL